MNIDYRYENFPRQKLHSSKKTKLWGVDVIETIEGLTGSFDQIYQNDIINYELANGIFNKEDLIHVTNPYGQDYEYPVDMKHYDIISSKLNLLQGEEIKRPFNFRAKAVNTDSVSRKSDRQKEFVLESVVAMWADMLSEEGKAQPLEAQFSEIEEISDYATYSFKEMHEVVAEDLLNYLIKNEDIQYKFNKGWGDALKVGREIYWTGIINGNPVVEVVNPVNFYYDKSDEVDFIEDSQWCRYDKYLTPGEIIDRFGEDLTDSQIERIERRAMPSSKRNQFGFNEIKVYRQEGPISMSTDNRRHEEGIRVSHYEWKSMRKIGFVTIINDEGEEEEFLVDDTFNEKEFKNDPTFVSIEWKWGTEVWEGTRIDEDIYVNIRRKPNQYISVDDPFKAKLSYTGLVYEERNSQPVSVLDRMKPYQYEFNTTMYQIGLEKMKAKGKKVIYDVAQLPTDKGWDMERWLYYADVLGIMFIDSHRENSKGEKSSFNQFRDIDQGLSQTVVQLFEYLNLLDYRCSKVSGVTEQREGQIGATELATNAQRAVVQSSHITELLFYKHNEVKKRVLTNLLECAKIAYRDGKKIQYITDDLGIKIINIDDDFLLADHGIFISNSTKDEEALQTAKEFSADGLRSGVLNYSDVLELISSDSLTRIKRKVEKSEKARQKREEQMQQEQLASQERMEQIKSQLQQQQIQLEMEKLRIQEESNIRDNETKLIIAQLSQSNNPELDYTKFKEELNLKNQERLDEKELEKRKIEDNKMLEMLKIKTNEKLEKYKANKQPKTAPKSK